ncbi:MAG TPA: hypothetical protein PLU72_00140 [Candidatus Ozemobacteraceae bacterium]|nr:hypothetical protein [Candidatus Ozemobacteraceae bacterium]
MKFQRFFNALVLVCIACTLTGCGQGGNGVSPVASSISENGSFVMAAGTAAPKETGVDRIVAYGIDIAALPFIKENLRNSCQAHFNAVVTAYDQEAYDTALTALQEFAGYLEAQHLKGIPEETYQKLKSFVDALTLNITAVSISLDPAAVTLKTNQVFDLGSVAVTATRPDGTTGRVTLAIIWTGSYVSGTAFSAPATVWKGVVTCRVANKTAELNVTVVPPISFDMPLNADWFKNHGICQATQDHIDAIRIAYEAGDPETAKLALADFIKFITIQATPNPKQEAGIIPAGFEALKAFADSLSQSLD